MDAHKEYTIDLDVLSGFIDEALDDLYTVTEKILALGEKGFDENLLNSIFRIFHSIKGNAAYFSLFQIKNLSHSIEQILDRIRKKEMGISDLVINLLLDGAGSVTSSFELIRAQGIDAQSQDFSLIIMRIEALLNSKEACPEMSSNDFFQDLVLLKNGECLVDSLISKYSAIQKEKKVLISSSPQILPDAPEEYRAVIDLLSTDIPGVLSREICDEIASLFEKLRQFSDSQEYQVVLDEVIGNFEVVRSTVGLDPLIRELLRDGLKKLPVALPKKVSGKQENVSASVEQTQLTSTAGSQSSKTMRVSEHAVDRFLAFVGELVVIEDMYVNITSEINSKTISMDQLHLQIKKTTDTFSALSRELQKSIMEIRKIPISQLFKRMPKLAHDVAIKNGKKIQVKILNENIRIDKTILENLESPLVHMIRNAADHGIEMPEIRVNQGKAEEGIISLDATEKGEQIQLTIEDDGAGINFPKVRKKGIELGLLNENTPVDEKKLVDIMFYSGVSTAEVVTDVSGRGVGMDVVKKNLEEIGGVISTTSVAGKGTKFVLTIPSSVTTQIINGFIVRTRTERYIIPLEFIEASMSVQAVNAGSITGKTHVINVNDSIVEIARLESVVEGNKTQFSMMENEIVVIVKVNNRKKAFIVSSVDGIRQVVLKPVNLPGQVSNFIVGGAVMGDGTVSLILDVEKLV